MSRLTRRRAAHLSLAGRAGTITLVFAAIAACASSDEDAPAAKSSPSASKDGGTVISLKLLQFSPAAMTVNVGTKVTWRNDESITHTVTSGTYSGVDGTSGLRSSERPDGLFDEKLANKGATATYTFSKPGAIEYYCDIHKGMNAKIVVAP